jgi:hypothetical protein
VKISLAISSTDLTIPKYLSTMLVQAYKQNGRSRWATMGIGRISWAILVHLFFHVLNTCGGSSASLLGRA